MGAKSCIITPTWNNEDYTIRCFDSIQKNTKNYKIIWIDNGSNLESREKVKKFLDDNAVPYELIQNEENLGFVKATNQGMRRAMELGVKYIVLQNNDTEVHKGWLKRMIEVAESDRTIGLVGPITSPCSSWQSIENLINSHVDFSDLPAYNANPEEYAKIIKEKYKGQSTESKVQLAFFSTLIKRDAVEEVGFLSEEFGIGFGDDDDYCIRALRAGWKLYLAKDVFVFHNHRTTFRSIYSEDKIKNMLENNGVIYRKKHSDFFNGNHFSLKKEKSIMTVCFVSHSAEMGGSERSLIELIKGLSIEGIMCNVLLLGNGSIETELKKLSVDYNIIPYRWWTLSADENRSDVIKQITEQSVAVTEKISEINPDIIYTNTSVINVGAIAANILGKPHIWHVREFGEKDHGLNFILSEKERCEFISNNSSYVVFNSHAVEDNFLKFSVPKKYEVVYNNVNVNDDYADKKVKYYNSNFKKLLILGSIVPGKGQMDAVMAVNKLIELDIPVELIIAGTVLSDEYFRKINEYIVNKKIEKYVKILPFIANPYPLVKGADILLSCSENEAFGRTIVEAMLLNKAVIGANSGGVPETIRDGYNGLLYESGNYKELAEKIKFLCENPEKIMEFGVNGYKFSKEHFSEQKYSGKIFKLLMGVKNDNGGIDTFNIFNLFYEDMRNTRGELNKKEQEIKQKYKETEKLNNVIHQKEQEIVFMQSSKFWKIREWYLHKVRKF